MGNFKIALLIIMTLCAMVAFMIPLFVSEVKYKNNMMTRTRIIVRVRVGCLLVFLVAILLCIIL